MAISALMALSPLDGRYQPKLLPLAEIFSEYGLIKHRFLVEVKWLMALCQIDELQLPPLSNDAQTFLARLVDNFALQDAEAIKNIENTTNHDVKAVEYYLKQVCETQPDLKPIMEFIHFGCTSEDINNLAYSLMLQQARQEVLLPWLNQLLQQLRHAAHEYADIVMLARTHGQAATPTTLGKEFANFAVRLELQLQQLADCTIFSKLNGATGNYSALVVACPEVDWVDITTKFITRLGLQANLYTTQIEPHDALAEFFAILTRINSLLLDFSRDMWSYIAINYFHQKSHAHEVGSSTMPHKINPIDFENAEGNLGLANALLQHMMLKLPVSRWQRDLSDSTVLRNIGVALGYGLLAYQSISKGLNKVSPNHSQLKNDLEAHWEVLAEPVQMVMRRYQLHEPYEQLKAFTRGKPVTQTLMRDFIQSLDIPETAKLALLALSPHNYVGLAQHLANKA